MSRAGEGWMWLDDLRKPVSDAGSANADLDLPRAVSRCFSGPDGRRVLQHLRAMTLERSLGPGASDTMLRHLEGQRSLVVYLITLMARGSGGGGAMGAPATTASEPGQELADVRRSAIHE